MQQKHEEMTLLKWVTIFFKYFTHFALLESEFLRGKTVFLSVFLPQIQVTREKVQSDIYSKHEHLEMRVSLFTHSI